MSKQLTRGLPVAPSWLSSEAREEWERAISSILPRDVASIDLTQFEVYCQMFARWQAAEKLLAEGTEVVVRNDKGEIKSIIPSPQIGISVKAHEQMARARKASGLERARELAG